MASSRQDDARAKYARVVPPPAAPIYSRWRIAPSGAVTRELMPSFIVRSGRMPEGYALKDSHEDRENERLARQAAGQGVPAPRTPVKPQRLLPPAPKRLRAGRT